MAGCLNYISQRDIYGMLRAVRSGNGAIVRAAAHRRAARRSRSA
ncbi:hypothetical protein BURMUCGD2_5752 [Burkholderia multivorans CGD2]|uniref:Uncharacterized protein n=1 Tax=Burkholderia multivorans CGD2 TaxID=513052 RepID=B9BKZ4_9BURK|nr:hypothetical protein BURMUCGD2_5752 [Burkholderia multivorans CGD2]